MKIIIISSHGYFVSDKGDIQMLKKYIKKVVTSR